MSRLLKGYGGPRPPSSAPTLPFQLAAGMATTGTSPTYTTTTDVPAGWVLWAVVMNSSTSSVNSFSDALGNTWTGNTAFNLGGAFAFRQFRCVVTTPIPAGSTLGPTLAASSTPRVVVFAVPTGSSFDYVSPPTAATNGTPTITTSALASQPQYILAAAGFVTNASTFTVSASGYTESTPSLVTSGSQGMRFFYKRLTATTAETFNGTVSSTQWGIQAITAVST
jgi:hypothetical protein